MKLLAAHFNSDNSFRKMISSRLTILRVQQEKENFPSFYDHSIFGSAPIEKAKKRTELNRRY